MKILNSDSQCVFRIILVEKLRFVRPNWNILLEITYDSKRLRALHCRVDFIFLSFGIMVFIVEL